MNLLEKIMKTEQGLKQKLEQKSEHDSEQELEQQGNRRLQNFGRKGLVIILAIMLLFTVISRITDSFTIARVTVENPSPRKIVHVVEAEGTVEKNLEVAIVTEPNILVKAIYANVGQKVLPNDLLAELDIEDLEECISQFEDDIKVLKLQNQAIASNAAISMKKISRWMINIICLVMITCLFGYGFVCYHRGRRLEQNVTIWKASGCFSISEMERIRLQQQEQGLETGVIQDFTAWSEKKGAEISAKNTGSATIGNVLTIYGSSELLLTYGCILNREDIRGCLIGEKTAEKLFGSRNAEGLELYYDNTEFIVRGVIDWNEEMLIVQANALQDVELDRITVRLEKGKQIKQFGEEFMARYGINGKMLRFDYYQSLDGLLEMIPGKWSNFDGWVEKIDSRKQDFAVLSSVEKSSIELYYLKILQRGKTCFVLGIIMLACLIW